MGQPASAASSFFSDWEDEDFDISDLEDEYARVWKDFQRHSTLSFNLTSFMMNGSIDLHNSSALLDYYQSANRSAPSDDYNIIHNVWVQVVICCLYVIIMTCGIFGNVLVIYVVSRNKAMHTVTNFFIASLAVNDVIICALTVPLTPLYTFLEGWYFGSFMCHLFPLIQAASVYISTLTLTAIAVERFCVICFPYLPKLTTKSASLIIASIWLLSITICTPYAIYMKYSFPHPDGRGPRCEEDWPSYARRTFGTVVLIVQYSIPLIVITVSYVSVWLKLRTQASKGLASSQRGREPTAIMRKKRTNRMLVAMVIIFGCCWLPLNLVNILNDYFPQTITGWEYFVLVFFLSHVVAVSSTCYNPILYAWMNENFRKEFKAVLPCLNHRPSGVRHLRYQSTIHYGPDGNEIEDGRGQGRHPNITVEAESTYLPNVGLTTVTSVRTASFNGSAKNSGPEQGNDQWGRGTEGHQLLVPTYVTLQVQQEKGAVHTI
ncbi:hypothetical protein RvY_03718 [Ramazzottius varieornatus]|uniref:G-protein coupled receptors family 1 profile domain-containing protein n=1 Tax=Ramazzottius varieornatus TaxID=947166 RepID=A0A1D1UZ87_RAMVA|nr:hypothetical protein RvY_03718 [Ramazzottius varieornatus]